MSFSVVVKERKRFSAKTLENGASKKKKVTTFTILLINLKALPPMQ